MKDEWRAMKDEWRSMKDEWGMMKDEWSMMKDAAFKLLRGFADTLTLVIVESLSRLKIVSWSNNYNVMFMLSLISLFNSSMYTLLH